jgi:iron complex outermembrane receptor protein
LYSLSQAFAFAANAFVDALRVPVVAGMHENCGGEPTPRREIMLKNVLVRRAVRYALLANTIALTCATVQAAEEPITEVVVTGSRIARPDVEASTPVQVLSGQAIDMAGSQNIADIIAALPAVGTPGLSRTNSNFLTSSNGVSTLNLRNMEDQRTLVLINGRRVVSGVDGTSTVDVNNIPTDLIESVQVLTGGASAVYGSEAVAGVVNFILKDDYEGLNFRGQTGGSTEGDAERHMFSLTGGLNIGDRGNVTANVQYDRDFGLRSRDRAISANDIPARSSLPPQGRFPLDGTNWTFGPDNVLKDTFDTPVDGFNRNAERYIATPLERTLVTVLGNYHLTDSVRLFAEGGYSKMKSNSSLEPLATTNADARLPDGTILPGLSRDNPFIPAPILAQMDDLAAATGEDVFLQMNKRMNGVFDRSNKNDRDFYRAVVGLDGDFGSDWHWETYYNRSQTKEATESETALRDRYYFALDAIADPVTGQPVCRDAAARAAGCAPFNPFGFDSVSQDAANYITAGGIKDTFDSKITQEVVAANITGPVFALPAGEVKIAAGAEYRKEQSEALFSPETQAGNTMGNALSNTTGEYNVKEAYVETIVPLLSNASFARSLDFEAAYRIGDYSTVGTVDSWKAGMTWAPIDDIRFRAVYSVATRAPNIGELFSGPNQTFEQIPDPCEQAVSQAGPVGDYCRSIPGIAQQLATTGGFAYTLGDEQSMEGLNLSNPNVKEEQAKTWTVGMVLTPQSFRNFTMSIDWFQIKVDDAITLVARDFILNSCVNSLGTDPLCARVTRENVGTPRPRTPGTVFTIDTLPLNAASIETSGVDVALGYALEFGAAQRLNVSLAYTYLDKLTLQQNPDLAPENEKGQLDGPGRLGAGFEHRANLGLTYSWDRFSANWRMNYLSAIKDTLNENGPTVPPDVNEIGSVVYHNVQARYAFGADREYAVYAGADNVFDKKPPVLGQNAQSEITGTETAADTYDPFGRMWYAGVEVTF